MTTKKIRFDDHKLYLVNPVSEKQVAALLSLSKDIEGFAVDGRIHLGRNPVMVPPLNVNDFKHVVDQNNINSVLLIDNYQQKVDDENPNSNQSDFGWTAYHSLEKMNEWLESLAAVHPQVTPIVGGRSFEGREIRGVKVSFNKGNQVVVLEGGIHSREWVAPAAVTFILNEVLTSQDPAMRAVADSFDWHVFPVVNPDGYEYSHSTDRNWRKNRKPVEDNEDIGVDLNRNFGTKFWGASPGASREPGEWNYCGSSPFSEPEAKSLAEYLTSIQHIDVYLAFHSFGNLLYFPSGHPFTPAAGVEDPVRNRKQLEMIGMKAAKAISQRYKTEFKVGAASDVLYAAEGLSTDWAYEVLSVPFVFTFELGPLEHLFLLPAQFIVPTSEETLDGVMTILSNVLDG